MRVRGTVRGILAGAAALLAAVGVAGAAETKRYSVVSSGEKVGSLVATIDGSSVDLDYIVRNNGRGPKWIEHIETGKDGRVVNWTIKGESTFGAAIDEEYVWADGRSAWRSQADAGEVASPSPAVYVANDSSPWSSGVYVRALLKAKDGKTPVLPGGMLRLETVGKDRLGEGRGALAVTIYAISGVDMQPSFVMIDKDGDLAATIGRGSVTVREGFEDQVPRLEELSVELTREKVLAMQRALSHRYEGPIHYQNVRVFDPVKGVTSKPARVIVFQDRIAAIDYDSPAAAPREGETVIDGQGGVLVPGLHDMHSHSSPWSGFFYLAAGVTGTRDQGNGQQEILELMADIEARDLAGPRIVRNGFIEGRSEHSARVAVIADTLEEGLDAVRWYADHGFFQIKLYNSIKPEWVKPLADEAKRLGLGVTGHVPAFMTPDEAILAGYDDIAHINQFVLGWLLEEGEDTRTPLRLTGLARGAYLDLDDPKVKRTIALMKKHGVALDTTTVILERLMLSRAGEVNEGDAPYLDHAPIGYQRYRKRTFVPLDRPEADEEYRKGFQALMDTMTLLYKNGVQLLPGTDDGTGFTVHRELELYAKAGIPNAEVLRLATIASEEYLRRDQELGTIEPGKYADFFLISEDPLEDISAIRGIRLVSRGDQIYFPSEIYEALAFTPFTEPPPVEQH